MFYFNLMGINFLTYSQTVAVFFIPIFAASGIGPLFVFTGLDRMLCVIFPTLFGFFYLKSSNKIF